MFCVRHHSRVFLITFAFATFLGYASLSAAAAQNSCQFNSAGKKIQHVIYIQFDNTHLLRDNPKVPSDLEQMPHLLNFLKDQGTLSNNHHTVLISHTANGILTSLTGVYSDRHGIAVANSFPVFRPDGSTAFPSSFFYWTDLVSDVNASTGDNNFAMLGADGKNAPAPWVPFTRAGCDLGAYSTANIVIERTPFDVNKVFGTASPESQDPNQFVNYAGTAIHCAQGSAICANPNTKAVADLLPQEPGSYTGYQALFGAKYINQAFQLKDIDGNPIAGFNSFSPPASETLGAIASMQEAGIPITMAYIADAHDNRATGVAFGPGEAGYVAQLQAYDQAFAKFFTRLAADGITKANTLFVFTADEGDHFAGGAPTPANCDGVTVPCTYSQIGEAELNLNGLVAANTGNTTPFSIHSDMAPTVNISGNPSYTSSTARQLERDLASLTVTNPFTGGTDTLAAALADPVEMGLLHMITADPVRTSTFTMFGAPDYFFFSSGSTTPVVSPGFAWNHGGIQPEIARTWLGLVGPGVRQLGLDATFSDHTDIRPTIMGLVGLQDDYVHDGRVMFEYLKPGSLPLGSTGNAGTLVALGQTYKQINAPFGSLGTQSLVISTAALKSNATGDAVYNNLEGKIADWHTRRDAIASQMKTMLEGAAFNNQSINQAQAVRLILQGQELLFEVNVCAQFLPFCESH